MEITVDNGLPNSTTTTTLVRGTRGDHFVGKVHTDGRETFGGYVPQIASGVQESM